MRIRKALIMAAGYGTRFLPVTKVVQKEMLPVLNKPVIDYIVDDCIRAGIEEILIVVNEADSQIEQYYTQKPSLELYLTKKGKADIAAEIQQLHTKASFTFIVDADDCKYGTALPLIAAERYLKDEEAFLVMTGDDFLYDPAGASPLAELVLFAEEFPASAIVTCTEVAEEDVFKYGIAENREVEGRKFLTRLIEKPHPSETTSRLAGISKYVFTPEIFPVLAELQPNEKSGEYFLTDAVEQLASFRDVALFQTKHMFLDCGNIANWLHTNMVLAEK